IISYPFTIQTDGDYRFWMRFLTTSNQDDSFFWRIDDGPWTIKNDEFGMGAWYQVDIPQDGSFVGEHTLEITYRENGTFLDKFIIQLADSPNPGDVASGEGPSETPTPGGNSFTAFQEEYFGPNPDPQATAAGADFENDGLPNVLEHLLGLNPTVADWDGSSMRIDIDHTGAQPLIDFSFSRDLLATGYYIDVEHSYDLSTWNRLTISSNNFNTNSLGSDIDQYTVTIPTDGSVGNFLRLKAVADSD
ncbi:MAG: hypothetical protein AAF546_15500, partial [Verrucomicrobiota bacterium]